MLFIDTNDGSPVTLRDIANDYASLKAENPDEYPPSLKLEFLEILLAAINGRNDLEIVGITHRETNRMIARLRGCDA